MAQMKAYPKNYQQAAEFLGGKFSRKLGNNTWLEAVEVVPGVKEQTFIGVRLHNTYVVKFWAEGQVTLHTGGWHTVTTKDRINEFTGNQLYQKNHAWFYGNRPFVEGMDVGEAVTA